MSASVELAKVGTPRKRDTLRDARQLLPRGSGAAGIGAATLTASTAARIALAKLLHCRHLKACYPIADHLRGSSL